MSDRIIQNKITCLCIIDTGRNAYKKTRNICVVFYNKNSNTKLYWNTTEDTLLLEELQEDMKYNISYLQDEDSKYIRNVKLI